MTTPVDNLSAVQSLKNDLILKALNYSVFIGGSTATALTQATVFSATTGQLNSTAFANYKDCGYITEDGAKFSRSRTRTDTTSLQSVSPTRSDITGDSTTLQFEAQETNLTTLSLYTGVAIATATPNAGGSISVDQSATPSDGGSLYAAVAYDTANDIYIIKHFPKGIIDSFTDQTYNKTAAITYGVTVKALFDSAVGTDVRWLFGGAGWLAKLADIGLTAGA